MKLITASGDFDRRNIMRQAHDIYREYKEPFGEALKAAWKEARRQKRQLMLPAIVPQRMPLEAAAISAVSLLKKLKNAKIEVGLRVQVKAGLRVKPQGEEAKVWTKDASVSALYARDPETASNQLRLR